MRYKNAVYRLTTLLAFGEANITHNRGLWVRSKILHIRNGLLMTKFEKNCFVLSQIFWGKLSEFSNNIVIIDQNLNIQGLWMRSLQFLIISQKYGVFGGHNIILEGSLGLIRDLHSILLNMGVFPSLGSMCHCTLWGVPFPVIDP